MSNIESELTNGILKTNDIVETKDILEIHLKIKKKLENFIEFNKIPHIIFHGASGSGKRHILNFFINKIYKDKNDIKKYVKFINCAHGKGIGFIRNELKFFAKTNINDKKGTFFKSIILFNADNLTIDAQSALRRCIEEFSHTTRFFIIVEEQNKLLKPIISRFCNIFIPIESINKKNISLHFFKNNLLISENNILKIKRKKWLKNILEKKDNYKNHTKCFQLVDKLYENGYSSLDVMDLFRNTNIIKNENKYLMLIYFDQMRKEFRNEKQLLFILINFMLLRKNLSLENIYNL